MDDYTSDYWKQYRASGRRRVIYVGLSGNASRAATIKSVSKYGVTVAFTDGYGREQVHPSDIRPA